MTERLSYSVVIPAFNEERRIATTFEHVIEYFSNRNMCGEIVVADDGSTDRTVEVVTSFRSRVHTLKLIRLRHQGKGSAVRHGVDAAHGEIVFLSDADMHEGLRQLEKLEAALTAGADIAIASRWIRKCNNTQPLYRRAGGRMFNLCMKRLLGLAFNDTQCGLKAFKQNAAKRIFSYQRINGWGFDPELLLIASRLGYQIAEVPITLQHDYSSSKFRMMSDGLVCFKDLFHILWHELWSSYPPRASTSAVLKVAAGKHADGTDTSQCKAA